MYAWLGTAGAKGVAARACMLEPIAAVSCVACNGEERPGWSLSSATADPNASSKRSASKGSSVKLHTNRTPYCGIDARAQRVLHVCSGAHFVRAWCAMCVYAMQEGKRKGAHLRDRDPEILGILGEGGDGYLPSQDLRTCEFE